MLRSGKFAIAFAILEPVSLALSGEMLGLAIGVSLSEGSIGTGWSSPSPGYCSGICEALTTVSHLSTSAIQNFCASAGPMAAGSMPSLATLS